MADNSTFNFFAGMFVIAMFLMSIALVGSVITMPFLQEVEYDTSIECDSGNIGIDYVKNTTNTSQSPFELHGVNGVNCKIGVKGKMPVFLFNKLLSQ